MRATSWSAVEKSSWDWRHSEMRLRSRIFELMEVSELLWELSGDTYPDDLREDGWLLVEEGRIVGATEFREEDTSWGRVWIWFWVYVDPEYRRKGVVTELIPRRESVSRHDHRSAQSTYAAADSQDGPA